MDVKSRILSLQIILSQTLIYIWTRDTGVAKKRRNSGCIWRVHLLLWKQIHPSNSCLVRSWHAELKDLNKRKMSHEEIFSIYSIYIFVKVWNGKWEIHTWLCQGIESYRNWGLSSQHHRTQNITCYIVIATIILIAGQKCHLSES